jgi:beta-1,2-mannobiose phosphorylase / 1,2-beta-oligomannan phosphorylase
MEESVTEENETCSPYALRRLGLVMEPDPSRPEEAWGVLNPASARTADGSLYLFPREVAEGNYSRIGRCRLCFDASGDPVGVERLGFALEPETPFERAERTHGGVEDPRITYLPRLGQFVMAYTALGVLGPRIALATSSDGVVWRRLGLVRFNSTLNVDFNRYGNKDCVLFPEPVTGPDGRECYALLHRPTYLVQSDNGTVELILPSGVNDARAAMWISYLKADGTGGDLEKLTAVTETQLLARPEQPWENLKIGAGTPPVLLEEGWLVYYHGVSGQEHPEAGDKRVWYRAGVMVLDRHDPRRIVYRSKHPVLEPESSAEREGVVPNVVFPTAVDVRGRRLDVYFGAADTRIGVATSELPNEPVLPASGPREITR